MSVDKWNTVISLHSNHSKVASQAWNTSIHRWIDRTSSILQWGIQVLNSISVQNCLEVMLKGSGVCGWCHLSQIKPRPTLGWCCWSTMWCETLSLVLNQRHCCECCCGRGAESVNMDLKFTFRVESLFIFCTDRRQEFLTHHETLTLIVLVMFYTLTGVTTVTKSLSLCNI